MRYRLSLYHQYWLPAPFEHGVTYTGWFMNSMWSFWSRQYLCAGLNISPAPIYENEIDVSNCTYGLKLLRNAQPSITRCHILEREQVKELCSYQFVVREPLGVVVEVPLERLALQLIPQRLSLGDVAEVAQSFRLRFVVLSQPGILVGSECVNFDLK